MTWFDDDDLSMLRTRRQAKNNYLKYKGKDDSHGRERGIYLRKFAAFFGYPTYVSIPISSSKLTIKQANLMKMMAGPYYAAAIKMAEIKNDLPRRKKTG